MSRIFANPELITNELLLWFNRTVAVGNVACSLSKATCLSNGLFKHLQAFEPCVYFLRARAVIKFVLRVTSTLEKRV